MPPDHSTAEQDQLVVLLHAYTNNAQSMNLVAAAISEKKPDAFIICPSLNLGRFSFKDPTKIALQLLDRIDGEVRFREEKHWPPFTEIILVGHSIGALIARKIYIIASGETTDAPFEFKQAGSSSVAARPWVDSVTRIVLLSGMNRGWSINSHMKPVRAVILTMASVLGNFLLSLTGKRFSALHIRRGAPFLTELRLQWIALERAAARQKRSLATVIQLLGTIDDIVSPDDNIDLVSGGNFLYLDMPHSGHGDVIQMDNTPHGKKRREVFQFALTAGKAVIQKKSYLPADAALPKPNPDVTDVIFVIHGIRDAGYWTRKVARKVQDLGKPRVYGSETSTYGYFPMLPFLLPFRRHQKVEWLMDQFVEARALYQNARFSYVGHSNGTYLLAYALKQYRACRFEHVVFAGSVVQRSYDWRTVIENEQVTSVLNYVATSDWVVAWFPGALEKLGLQDLGTAGHNGFRDASKEGPVYERRCIPGQHSAALSEDNWDDIGYFIVHGEPSKFPSTSLAQRRAWWVVGIGWVAPLVWLVLIGLFIVLPVLGILCLAQPQWLQTLELVAFGWIIVKVLTRL